MTDLGHFLLGELDPNKKDAVWMNDCLSAVRRDWTPLVNAERVRLNKQYLLGQQSLHQVKQSFKDKKFLETVEFRSLGFMETPRNAMVEELLKMPPTIGVKAEDPTAISEKKKDIQILKTKRIIEQDISSTNGQIGLPSFKLDPKNFKGNIEEFDDMGLDANDPDDVSFFSKDFHRLWFEIAAQSVINNVFKLNKFDKEMITDLVIDILAVRATTMQSYVDQITGELKQRYIFPETAYGIWGTANDGHDDVAKGWEDTKTVWEWMQMVGDKFDFEKNWFQLLSAVNYFPNGRKYTGFRRNGRTYSIAHNHELRAAQGIIGDEFTDVDFNTIYSYKVYVGYVEFSTIEATSTALFKRGTNPNEKEFDCFVSYNYKLKDQKATTEYFTESKYQQQFYKSYFLSTSSLTQFIYNWGKVYYQHLEGANDEYASGTLLYYREKGESVMDISRQLIDMGNLAFYKMLFAVHKAKPEEDVIVFEEMLEVTKALKREYPQTGTLAAAPTLQNIFEQAIQFQQENSTRVRAFPRIDGKAIGQLPPLEGKRNGLDPVAVAMQSVHAWVEALLNRQFGWNPMRSGANPQSRESFDTEQQTLNASFNSTGYIYRMVQKNKEGLATRALYTAQDIIRFKESIPYKWLKTLVSDQSLRQLEALEDIAAHRLGVYCSDYSYAQDKNDIKQAANIALTQKTITFDQWFACTQTEDYKKAALLLSHFQKKTEKKIRQQQLQDMQVQDQLSQAAFERQLQLIDRKGQYDVQVSQNQKEAAIISSQIQSDSRIQTKQIQVEAEQPKQQAKTEGQKELLREESNIQNQQPYEATSSSEAA